MIQSSTFWLVLAAAVVAFWLLPIKWRLGFLALVSFGYLVTLPADQPPQGPHSTLVSLGYLLSQPPVSIAILAGWSLLFFLTARKAGKKGPRRWIVPGLILAIVAYLAAFKYIPPLLAAFATNPIERDLLIPLGISYFTFKLIHYAVEVGRGNIKDRSLVAFLCYIFLFPIFTAGPIERFDHFLASREPRLTIAGQAEGLLRIAQGLVKKFVIADLLLGLLYNPADISWIVHKTAAAGPPTIWRYMVLAYLAMYLDFSAYSDVAIGASRLFGLRILENFNWPITAPSVVEFWKRWHMTLANWCMSYIYMPVLGLRRNPYLAAYATFVVMGLWHAGAGPWILWGLYNATGLVACQWWGRYRKQRKWKFFNGWIWRGVAIAMTFLFVAGSFAFSATYALKTNGVHGSTYDSMRVLARMFYVTLPAWR